MCSVIEDWYTLDSDQKKVVSQIESLEKKLEEQSSELQQLRSVVSSLSSSQTLLLDELKLLRREFTMYHQSSHKERTNELLEELKVIKQRELNLYLREKIPVPFFASTETLLTKKMTL
jgi:chromosome segregation ATPase